MAFNIKHAAVAAVLSALTLVGSASADSIGGATTTSSVNLRAGAGTDAAIIDTLPRGSALVVEKDLKNGWYQVNYGGERGYMASAYLNFSQSMALLAEGYVSGTGVRLRAGAGTEHSILGSYTTGDRLDITGVEGSWFRVKTASGAVGYVSSSYVALAAEELSVLPANTGEEVVELAKQYLGYKYVWAGASPNTGFDCSGFVSYVMKTLGYETNRTAQDIYQNGTYVAKADLRPGDALFFGSSESNIWHTGIYIGDGQFIHSSSAAGCVVITDLDSNYYTKNYVGARRIAA